MSDKVVEQKIALKVGEIKAFTDISLEFLGKTAEVLSKAYGKKFVASLTYDFQKLSLELSAYSKGTDYHQAVTEKSKKTAEKIIKMQDLYIKDEWDNATELTEWLGFFVGSAVVHWSLVLGKAVKSKNTKLSSICRIGKKLNTTFFKKVVSVAEKL